MSVKKIILRELGYLVISLLLVALSYMIAGVYFKIWLKHWGLLGLLVIIFYCIIGFYRLLNYTARKYRKDNNMLNRNG